MKVNIVILLFINLINLTIANQGCISYYMEYNAYHITVICIQYVLIETLISAAL